MVRETALYDRLGIRHDASAEEIRKSYRQAALRYHPDRNQNTPGAEESFKECLHAYEVLSDPNTRATYDQYGMHGLRGNAQQQQQQYEQQQQQQQQQQQHNPFWNLNSFEEQQRRRREQFFGQRWNTNEEGQNNEQNDQDQNGDGSERPYVRARFSFNMATATSNGPNGTYETRFHSYDSNDGHRSAHRAGNVGDAGFAEFERMFNTAWGSGSRLGNSGVSSRPSLFAGSNMAGSLDRERSSFGQQSSFGTTSFGTGFGASVGTSFGAGFGGFGAFGGGGGSRRSNNIWWF